MPLPGCTVNEDEVAEDVTEATASVIEWIARNSDLDEAAILYKKLMQGSVTTDQVCHADVVTRIHDALQKEIKSLKPSRTATLRLQCMDMLDILWKHIRAERTGNWELHLQALSEMLPYLAASGHSHYTKSGLVYLQRMSSLQDDHPCVCEHFKQGLHVVRRSDRHWVGLSSDLVIEQVLM